ncbi:hypothetical protein ACJ73_10291 [Blastomyces percursus]|uniref:Mitochondrial adapter protein MCP1 transmembrane domain-containing protein n=1 Tax=Blastomyces percursus TaxID=1658174 RepID=A0A1J9PNN9_9EURO|nr:hypothetical protein ACJ73_10291 [Blastomyces percursus]
MDGQQQTSGRRRILPSETEDSFVDPLQELDPSPLDWTQDLEQGGYSLNISSASKSSEIRSHEGESNHGSNPTRRIGLSGKGWEYWLSTLQRTSTYPPTVFLTLHLTNTSLIPLLTNSIPASEPYLLLVTLPILTHLASGVALRILRARRRARLYGAETRAQRHELRASGHWRRPSAQAWLGYLLLPLLGSHVLVNRVVPVVVDGGSSGVGLGLALIHNGRCRRTNRRRSRRTP